MAGNVEYRKDRDTYRVIWWNELSGKKVRITRYKGELIGRNKKTAYKLLAIMQADVEAGTFRLEKYMEDDWTDVESYLWEWLDAVEDTLSPATYKDYYNSIHNYLVPFCQKYSLQLHQIKYDILIKLLGEIKSGKCARKGKRGKKGRDGKGASNVINCLHACLKYAHKSERLLAVSAFPEKKKYKLIEPEIKWIDETRQMKILAAIPDEDRPLFLWLKYHLRRPAEGYALHKQDYRPDDDSFKVCRTFSNRVLVERTKTGDIHYVPCHSGFDPRAALKNAVDPFSPFFFTCKSSRGKGKHYTDRIAQKIWKKACKEVGEDIPLYAGTKHSSCSQYINDKDFSFEELQMLTDHANLDSVKRYAQAELKKKKSLMDRGKIVPLGKKKATG